MPEYLATYARRWEIPDPEGFYLETRSDESFYRFSAEDAELARQHAEEHPPSLPGYNGEAELIGLLEVKELYSRRKEDQEKNIIRYLSAMVVEPLESGLRLCMTENHYFDFLFKKWEVGDGYDILRKAAEESQNQWESTAQLIAHIPNISKEEAFDETISAAFDFAIKLAQEIAWRDHAKTREWLEQ